MNELLLTSLCTVCRVDPPIYTCPRCLANTCSLNCSKRHKIWSSCNGIRDPTIYKPISEVATPSGIDHDYNFIHSIEHGISRSEKVLIEDLGLVSREELKRARAGEDEISGRKRLKRNFELPGEFCISKLTQEKNIQILRAPKGMRRNKENTTTWNRKRKTVDWQVEWLRMGPLGIQRLLHKVSGFKPIGDEYDMICEEERLMQMTDDERRQAKKRKSQEMKDHASRMLRAEVEQLLKSPLVFLQDSNTKTWYLKPNIKFSKNISENKVSVPAPRKYYLYIHRPLTPASFPKVLAAIDPEKSLTEILADRCILEYPTIYVLEKRPSNLPDEFMSEENFIEATQKICSNQQHQIKNTGDANKQSNPSLDFTESSYDSESSKDSDSDSDSSSSSNDKEEIKKIKNPSTVRPIL